MTPATLSRAKELLRSAARGDLGAIAHGFRALLRRIANPVFRFPPARALLKVRPAYFPAAVILRGGRSRWPANKPIRFVTSFSHSLYEATGRRCVETFRTQNPDFELWTYIESADPAKLQAMQAELSRTQTRWVDLASLPMLGQLLEVARDVIPVAYGGDALESQFPPPETDSGGGYFRRNMFRWFRKVVALDHLRQGYDGVLVWMDCDCFAKAPLPASRLARAFGGAGVFYMKGTRAMTEMGLVGFDFAEPGVHQLIDDLKAHYLSRRFVQYRQWDDCTSFDLLRSTRRVPECRDIGTWMELKGQHILRSTMLAPYLEHDKGAHGRGGARLDYDTGLCG